MQIHSQIYKDIISFPKEIPPETGGILGGMNGVIRKVVFDKGISSQYGCRYTPDVKKFNIILQNWQEESIEFMGMFHTHFWGVDTLSDGDKKYIEKIMMSMPLGITELYFPIVVMPLRDMVVYKARKENGRLVIKADEIIIIRTE